MSAEPVNIKVLVFQGPSQDRRIWMFYIPGQELFTSKKEAGFFPRIKCTKGEWRFKDSMPDPKAMGAYRSFTIGNFEPRWRDTVIQRLSVVTISKPEAIARAEVQAKQWSDQQMPLQSMPGQGMADIADVQAFDDMLRDASLRTKAWVNECIANLAMWTLQGPDGEPTPSPVTWEWKGIWSLSQEPFLGPELERWIKRTLTVRKNADDRNMFYYCNQEWTEVPAEIVTCQGCYARDEYRLADDMKHAEEQLREQQMAQEHRAIEDRAKSDPHRDQASQSPDQAKSPEDLDDGYEDETYYSGGEDEANAQTSTLGAAATSQQPGANFDIHGGAGPQSYERADYNDQHAGRASSLDTIAQYHGGSDDSHPHPSQQYGHRQPTGHSDPGRGPISSNMLRVAQNDGSLQSPGAAYRELLAGDQPYDDTPQPSTGFPATSSSNIQNRYGAQQEWNPPGDPGLARSAAARDEYPGNARPQTYHGASAMTSGGNADQSGSAYRASSYGVNQSGQPAGNGVARQSTEKASTLRSNSQPSAYSSLLDDYVAQTPVNQGQPPAIARQGAAQKSNVQGQSYGHPRAAQAQAGVASNDSRGSAHVAGSRGAAATNSGLGMLDVLGDPQMTHQSHPQSGPQRSLSDAARYGGKGIAPQSQSMQQVTGSHPAGTYQPQKRSTLDESTSNSVGAGNAGRGHATAQRDRASMQHGQMQSQVQRDMQERNRYTTQQTDPRLARQTQAVEQPGLDRQSSVRSVSSAPSASGRYGDVPAPAPLNLQTKGPGATMQSKAGVTNNRMSGFGASMGPAAPQRQAAAVMDPKTRPGAPTMAGGPPRPVQNQGQPAPYQQMAAGRQPPVHMTYPPQQPAQQQQQQQYRSQQAPSHRAGVMGQESMQGQQQRMMLQARQ